MWWIYPVYVVLVAAVVYVSIKLGDMVDLLDKKTKISGAFIGGVLLAAVTSLPELFTAISSVLIVKDASLAIGDILGSDIFNLMILGVYTLMFFKNFRHCKINKFHIFSLIVLIFFYLCTAYAVFAPVSWQPMLGDINALSIVIFIIYVITVIKQPKEENKDEAEVSAVPEKESKLSLKVIIILFIVLSIVLIGVSIGISLVTEKIIEQIPALAGSVGGAVLLGICTSLPEVISTFHLFRLKNFDAGYGNMIGSCAFNFSILAIADFISWEATCGDARISERGIFWNDASAQWMTIFGFVVIFAVLIVTCLKCYTKFFEGKKRGLIAAILLAVVALGGYVCSLILKIDLVNTPIEATANSLAMFIR